MPDFKEWLYNLGGEMRSVCILCLLKYEINLKMCYLGEAGDAKRVSLQEQLI